ncbi:MAG: helix-turn-helix domain-containing protein [Stenotrophomonas sp.]
MSSRGSTRRRIEPQSGDPFSPSREFPIRCVVRTHSAQTEVQVHSHPWAQMVFSEHGTVRVQADRKMFTVPPWSAVWIPAGTLHLAVVAQEATLIAVHLLTDPGGRQDQGGWKVCQVLQVRPLLRELVKAICEDEHGALPSERYANVVELVMIELRTAPRIALGISMPEDKRLRSVCEAFLADARQDRALAEVARSAGASVSTINRLFQSELGCSFAGWRKQVLLARAFALAAEGSSVSHIAMDLGYSSVSSFSYMVTQLLGLPPSKVLGRQR